MLSSYVAGPVALGETDVDSQLLSHGCASVDHRGRRCSDLTTVFLATSMSSL